jgi:hypothetical protein
VSRAPLDTPWAPNTAIGSLLMLGTSLQVREGISAVAALSLGRPLSGNAPNVSVNLLAPDAMQTDRVNILDLRFGKVLRFGGKRALVALDLYNAPNLDTVLSYAVGGVVTYVPNGRWLVPNQVLTARTAKLTVQYDF